MKFIIITLLFISTILNANTNEFLTLEEKAYLKNKGIIKIHAEQDWAPYNFVENNQATGYVNEMIKLMFKKLPVEYEFVKGHSWNEYLEMLSNDKIDIVSNITKTSQREKLYNYTNNSVFEIKMSIMGKNDYKKFEDLNGLNVGIINENFQEID